MSTADLDFKGTHMHRVISRCTVLFIRRRNDCGYWKFGGVMWPYDTALEKKGTETPIQHYSNRQENWPLLCTPRALKNKSVAALEMKENEQ